MKNFIASQQDLVSHEDRIPEGTAIVHFKLVGVGPKTLSEAGYMGKAVSDRVDQIPGFFVLSEDGMGIRECLHDLVDKFCDAQEQKD